jgi:hypothetical protein
MLLQAKRNSEEQILQFLIKENPLFTIIQKHIKVKFNTQLSTIQI